MLHIIFLKTFFSVLRKKKKRERKKKWSFKSRCGVSCRMNPGKCAHGMPAAAVLLWGTMRKPFIFEKFCIENYDLIIIKHRVEKRLLKSTLPSPKYSSHDTSFVSKIWILNVLRMSARGASYFLSIIYSSTLFLMSSMNQSCCNHN